MTSNISIPVIKDREMWHIIVFALFWNVLWWGLLLLFWGHLAQLLAMGVIFTVGSIVFARMVARMGKN